MQDAFQHKCTDTRPNVQWVYVKENKVRETYLVLKQDSKVLYYPWSLWEGAPQTCLTLCKGTLAYADRITLALKSSVML